MIYAKKTSFQFESSVLKLSDKMRTFIVISDCYNDYRRSHFCSVRLSLIECVGTFKMAL